MFLRGIQYLLSKINLKKMEVSLRMYLALGICHTPEYRQTERAIRRIYSDRKSLSPYTLALLLECLHKLNWDSEADEVLNEEAKSTARRKVLEQAGRKLEVLKQKRIYSDLIEELEAKLADTPVNEDMPLFKFLRESEIRDRLTRMTKEQILSHFGDSLFDGSNPLLIDAILNAPPGFELLPEDILNKLRIVRGKRINPELASEIETLRRLEYMIVKIFRLVKRELDTLRRKELPLSLVKTLATETASS